MKYCYKFFFFPFSIIFILTGTSTLKAQPDTLWTKTFGGSNIDVAYSVKPTYDSGFVVTGYTRSYGAITGRNIWLLKTDYAGTELWNNTFGGNADDEGYSTAQTRDGGYIITGYTKSSGAGGTDVILVKTDASGNELWKKTFGGTSDDEGYSVLQSNDGGYIIAGATSSYGAGSRDVWVIKTDSLGNSLWEKTYGGMSSDGARSVYQTFDSGYVITGWTFSYGPGFVGNSWILKINSSGIEQWNNFFGGSDADRGLDVQQTSDSGYIVTGYTASYGAGLDDMLLVKYNSTGTELWNKTFGGTGRDYGNAVSQTRDGGFVVTGYTLSFGAGGDDLWLVKTNSNGIEEWSKTFGGTASDVGYSVEETNDGGFIIAGHTLSFGAGVHDVWLIRTASIIPVELTSFTAEYSGGSVKLFWTTASEINNHGFEIQRMETGSNWIPIAFMEGAGTTTEMQQYSFIDKNISAGKCSYRLKQVDLNGSYEYSNTIEVDVNLPSEFSIKQNYPNPFNPETVIDFSLPVETYVTIRVFNILGDEVALLLNEKKSAGNYSIGFNAEGLPSGIYFYTIQAGSYGQTKKMILLK